MKGLLAAVLFSLAGMANAEEALYQLTIANALPNGSDLEVRLATRDGKVVAALGRAPRFNRMPATVDGSGITVTGGRARGELKITIPSDGYVPADGKPFTNTYRLANDLTPLPATASKLARVTLNCENAVNQDLKKGGARRMQLVFGLREGKGFAGRAVPPGSLTDVACAPFVAALAVSCADHRLTGNIELMVVPQSSEKTTGYRYLLDGQIVGDWVAGTMRVMRDGKEVSEAASFTGEARWDEPPTATDCLWKLTLRDLLGYGKFVDLYLATRDGKFTHGFGTSPNFNNATHEVDLSKLRLDSGKVTGGIGLTVLPDPWIPKDRQPIHRAVAVVATLDGGELTGQFTALKMEGVVEGGIDPKPAGKLAGGVLKLENALHGDGSHFARAFVSFELRDGRVVGGKISNNHSRLAGEVTGGDLKFDGDRLTGKLIAKITNPGGGTVKPGDYEFTVDTMFVGAAGAGTFESRSGEAKKTGRLWGVLTLER